MNYIASAMKIVQEELGPGEDEQLVWFYTQLALTVGVDVTRKHVHDAWAIWTNGPRGLPVHSAIVPFEALGDAVQALDQPYVEAIARAARRLAAA